MSKVDKLYDRQRLSFYRTGLRDLFCELCSEPFYALETFVKISYQFCDLYHSRDIICSYIHPSLKQLCVVCLLMTVFHLAYHGCSPNTICTLVPRILLVEMKIPLKQKNSDFEGKQKTIHFNLPGNRLSTVVSVRTNQCSHSARKDGIFQGRTKGNSTLAIFDRGVSSFGTSVRVVANAK